MRELLSPGRLRRTAARGLTVGLLLSGELTASFALDPAKDVSQYTRDSWTIEDGLPQSSVQAILQTRRGDLWLATQGGLARFDGVRFEVFDRSNSPAILSNHITCLSEDDSGRLWAGTHRGALMVDEHGVTAVPRTADLLVTSIIASQPEGVWIGTRHSGLYRLAGDEVSVLRREDGLADDAVMSLAAAPEGSLWIGTRQGLNRLEDGRLSTFHRADGLAAEIVGALHVSRDGTLLAGTAEGLSRYDGAFSPVDAGGPALRDAVWSIAEDDTGNLWVATQNGLSRLAGGHLATATTEHGLPSNLIRSLLVDREGSLWVGTFDGGLMRLGDGAFTTWSTAEGLSHDTVMTVLEDRRLNLWIGTFGGGLNRLADGGISHYTTADGLSSNHIWSLAEDAGGALWIGTFDHGLNRLAEGRCDVFTVSDGLSSDSVKVILPASDGSLLIGTSGGLDRFHDGRFDPVTAGSRRVASSVTDLHRASTGWLWIGTLGDGLSRLSDGSLETFTTADGLSSDTVFALHEDASGNLWIATQDGGLNRWRDGRFTVFSSRVGLVDDTVHQILEDDDGRLWMSSNKGIFYAELAQLEAVATGRASHLEPVAFGTEDGLATREASGGSQPAGWRGQDGRLWFPTVSGVSVIDPAGFEPRPAPRPVVIESVLVDGEPLPSNPGSEIPAGSSRLEIDYAALSFLAPTRIRYRYRLEGFDPEWVDAGGRRQAFYTRIPPGHYRFAVTASYDGVTWSPEPATLELTQRPRFYQTGLFYLALILAAALGGVGSHHLRVRHLKRRERELARRVEDSLAQIGVLRGMLPICASCKRIRDDRGYWNQLEAYLSEHSRVELSHALCPSCTQELYPQLNITTAPEPDPTDTSRA